MKPTKQMCLLAIFGAALVRPLLAAAPSPWEKPAADLAEQIASILGPGQAHLTIRNLSTIPNDEIPAIRRAACAGFEGARRGDGGRGEREYDSRDAEREREGADSGGGGGEGTQSQVAMVESGADCGAERRRSGAD